MLTVGLELNDACFAVARDGEVRLAGPGYAVAEGDRLCFGEEARARLRLNPRAAQRRYWAALSDATLPQPVGGCGRAADLVHEHLAALWVDNRDADAVILGVMPGWTAAQLGLLLGIARDVGMPVAGLVDAAVAASRRPCPGRTIWHLQATLDAAWLTRVEQSQGMARLGARERIDRCGVEALERGCAEFIARRFVECSRFDPLHDAVSEQRLYDALPGWLADASRRERVDLALEWRGNRYQASVGAEALRDCVARLAEPLNRRLRALASPREPSALLVHHRLADFPGLVDALLRLPACTPVLLEPGAAARGALRLRPVPNADGALHMTTALHWDQPPQDMAAGESAGESAGGQQVPTHVVFAGRAWRIADGPVHIGTALADDEYGIRLDARAQAVSRRHCAISIEDGRVVVHDQSRYGTLLNGHRVEGSAVLEAGDEIVIGQPPLEFALIAEVTRGP